MIRSPSAAILDESRRAASRACFRRLSSGYNTKVSSRVPFSVSNLGLGPKFISPVAHSIQQLPEVATAWENPSAKSSIENLERASQVFTSSNFPSEHKAVQALLAEFHQRAGQYDEAEKSIEEMRQADDHPGLALALSKNLWYQGKFEESQALCDGLLNDSYGLSPLYRASAMTGRALSQLASMKDKDDAFSVRDYFRMAEKLLENKYENDMIESTLIPSAAACLNCGVAEAVYAEFLKQVTNNVHDIFMEPALRIWLRGIHKLEDGSPVVWTLRANLNACISWAVLNYDRHGDDRVKRASEYAGHALTEYDFNADVSKERLCRMLVTVADCYQHANQAVTAEGLYQSAVSTPYEAGDTFGIMDARDAHRRHATLCHQWENREGDAEKHEDKATALDATLPSSWKGKSGIFSNAWFWTPGEMMQT